MIVNEYIENQGISQAYRLYPLFDDGVGIDQPPGVVAMIFREGRKGGAHRAKTTLPVRERRGYDRRCTLRWSHEIPARFTEPGGLRRHRRVSVTFRKVNDASVNREPQRPRKRKFV